jgi:CheY-like chemotaxis protein
VEILTAATREEALSIIGSTDDIAIVVTDLRMPDFGDGEAVAVAAQQKGIKVIVLSGTLSDLSEAVRGNCLAVFDKEKSSARDVADVINGSLKS